MDPDVTLTELLNELAEESPDVAAVREKVESLDTWLSKGGMLPARWHR